MFKVLGSPSRGIRLVVRVIILVALNPSNIRRLILVLVLEVEDWAISIGINGRDQTGKEPLINLINVIVDPILDDFQNWINRVIVLGESLGETMVNLRPPIDLAVKLNSIPRFQVHLILEPFVSGIGNN